MNIKEYFAEFDKRLKEMTDEEIEKMYLEISAKTVGERVLEIMAHEHDDLSYRLQDKMEYLMSLRLNLDEQDFNGKFAPLLQKEYLILTRNKTTISELILDTLMKWDIDVIIFKQTPRVITITTLYYTYTITSPDYRFGYERKMFSHILLSKSLFDYMTADEVAKIRPFINRNCSEISVFEDRKEICNLLGFEVRNEWK